MPLADNRPELPPLSFDRTVQRFVNAASENSEAEKFAQRTAILREQAELPQSGNTSAKNPLSLIVSFIHTGSGVRSRQPNTDDRLIRVKGAGLVLLICWELGLPRGRIVDCKPKRFTFHSTQSESPNGRPRLASCASLRPNDDTDSWLHIDSDARPDADPFGFYISSHS